MISDEPGPALAGRLFRTSVGEASEVQLRLHGLYVFTPNTEVEVDGYLVAFCEGWRQRNHGGPLPDPGQIRLAMDAQDRNLLWLWGLAREEAGLGTADPEVAIAPVLSLGNPVIIPSVGRAPLIVMAEGLWGLVMKVVLGILTWADGPAGYEEAGLAFVREACNEWRTNDPRRGPSGTAVIALSTLDQSNTTFAVGLAHAFFTWAYLHELGHFRLGHLPAGLAARSALDDLGASTSGTEAEVRFYAHSEELQADRFAVHGYLRLMAREMEIRTRLEMGAQIDHAPLIGMEIINLAMRLSGRLGSLESATHPAPLARRTAMADAAKGKHSVDGVSFYEGWRARLDAVADELGIPGGLV